MFSLKKFGFSKKSKEVAVKKSHSFGQGITIPGAFLVDGFSKRIVTPQRALLYYDTAAPLATAIDLINDEFKILEMAIKTNGDIELDHPILEFLQQPNDDMTIEDFLETLGIYFLVTNEAYIIATGNVNMPPSELILVSPEIVDVRRGRDGFVDRIDVQRHNFAKETFLRDDLQFRFFNQDDTAEIWQIKGFNTRHTGRGKSKLSSIQNELDQYIEASVHNLGLLQNGMRPSGAFSTKEPLPDDQFERLKEQIESFYSGSENAGNSLVLDNGMEFGQLSINPKDMDFANLKKSVSMAIFNRYKVPLPLINPDKMTLANMDSAKLNLYDNAVLPFAQRMFSELTRFLAPRFKLAENETIVPFMDSIVALKTRRNEELKLEKELNVSTINETRNEIGKEPIAEGGDIVYISNTVVPSGSTNNVSEGEVEENAKTTREGFITILKAQTDIKGNRTFTDEDIKRIADEEGL